MGVLDDVRGVARIGDALSDKISMIHEPQRNYMFEFAVFETSASGLFPSEMKAFVKSLEIPAQTRDPIIVDFLDTKIIFSGKDSGAHTFTVTFWDEESLTVHAYLHKWYELSGSHKYGEGANKVDYIKNVDINYRDMADIVNTGTINVRHVFPTEISAINLNYDGSEVVEITVTFSYDYIEFGDFIDSLTGTLGELDFNGMP